MLKPERLISDLNNQYNQYLELTDPDAIRDALTGLVQTFERFLSTNLIYWSVVNIPKQSGTVLLAPDYKRFFLATFTDTKGSKMVVPVREMNNGHSQSYYMLPSIFPVGEFDFAGVKYRSTPSGLEFVHKSECLNAQYIELIHGNSFDSTLIENIISNMSRNIGVMLPIDVDHHIYQSVGDASLHYLPKAVITARVVFHPNARNDELLIGERDYGYACLNDGAHYLLADVTNAYVYSTDFDNVNTDASIAYRDGRYCEIQRLEKIQMFVLRELSSSMVDKAAEDEKSIHYVVNNRMALAK